MATAKKTAAKKTTARKPKAAPPAPPVATAMRAGPGYTITVKVAGLEVNGEPMPQQLAADAIAGLLERSLRKARRA